MLVVLAELTLREIENKRREKSLPFFNQWGIPTAISIIEAAQSTNAYSVIGSGGIYNQLLTLLKALAIGADAIGLAGYLLKNTRWSRG